MHTKNFVLTTQQETEKAGKTIGRNIKGGEIFELASDLGGGKTTLISAIVAGTGSTDKVSSPTFTIRKDYKTRDLNIHHFDFYRLSEPGLMIQELAELIGDSRAVVFIEWADTVQGILPKEKICIKLDQTTDSPGSRRISIKYPDKLRYLLEGI